MAPEGESAYNFRMIPKYVKDRHNRLDNGRFAGVLRAIPLIQLLLGAVPSLAAIALLLRYGTVEKEVSIAAQQSGIALNNIKINATQGRLVPQQSIEIREFWKESPLSITSQKTRSTNALPESTMISKRYYKIFYNMNLTNPAEQPITVTSHMVYLYSSSFPVGHNFSVVNQPGADGPVQWNELGSQLYDQSYGNTGVYAPGSSTNAVFIFVIKDVSADLIAVRSVVESGHDGQIGSQEATIYCNLRVSRDMLDCSPDMSRRDERGQVPGATPPNAKQLSQTPEPSQN